LFEERTNVLAGRGARASERNDTTDFRERQTEPACLPDEREQSQYIGGIAPIARWLTVRRLQNAARLVEAKGLAAEAAPLGDLADQQSVTCHGESVNPAPWVKVKRRSPSSEQPSGEARQPGTDHLRDHEREFGAMPANPTSRWRRSPSIA
jgi:hypothetical protein